MNGYTIGTDFALARQRLDEASDDGRIAEVVAPRDRSRTSAEGVDEYLVILHKDLAHGSGIPIKSLRLAELRATRVASRQLSWVEPVPITDDNLRDKVPGFDGRWLAGFAPIGGTGFAVIVQTRSDSAVRPNARLSNSFARRAVVIVAVWLVLIGASLLAYRRYQRGVTLAGGALLRLVPAACRRLLVKVVLVLCLDAAPAAHEGGRRSAPRRIQPTG